MVNSETIEVTVNPNAIVLKDCEALVRSVPVMPEEADFCEAIGIGRIMSVYIHFMVLGLSPIERTSYDRYCSLPYPSVPYIRC